MMPQVPYNVSTVWVLVLPLRKLEIGRSRLPLASQVEIIRFAADILNDAMKNGFVHGDIKIDNLAVMNDGSLIINGYDRPRRNSITPEGTMSLPGIFMVWDW